MELPGEGVGCSGRLTAPLQRRPRGSIAGTALRAPSGGRPHRCRPGDPSCVFTRAQLVPAHGSLRAIGGAEPCGQQAAGSPARRGHGLGCRPVLYRLERGQACVPPGPSARISKKFEDTEFQGLFQLIKGLPSTTSHLRLWGPQDGSECTCPEAHDLAWSPVYKETGMAGLWHAMPPTHLSGLALKGQSLAGPLPEDPGELPLRPQCQGQFVSPSS